MLVSVFLLGNREILNFNTTPGYLFALVLIPLWIVEFRRYRYGTGFVVLSILCLCNGLWLGSYATVDHVVSRATLIGAIALFIGYLLIVMVLLWARRIFPSWVLGLVFGLGMLTSISTKGLAAENFWKFALATPLTIIALALAAGIRAKYGKLGQFVELGVLGTMALMALLFDSRSMFGTLLVVIVLALWQLLPKGKSLRNSLLRSAVTLSLVITAIYNIGTSMALEGLLGQAAQQRSEMQLAMSGSLILGGRPEMMATFSLFAYRPMGYGMGVVPELSDIMVAKEGMASIGYNPDNGYVERFMFGHQFELHSLAADLWVTLGFAGLILAFLLGMACVLWILQNVVSRTATALVIFLAIYTLWNLLFSPFYSALPTLGLAVGLIFNLRKQENQVQGRIASTSWANDAP